MRADLESRPETYSTALLDSLVCPVLVDARALHAALPAGAPLSLPRLPRVPAGLHPIIIEIWRVRDGLIDVGGVNAHRLWELAGGMAGLGFGLSVGAMLGAGIGAAAGAGEAARGLWRGPLGWWQACASIAAGAAAGSSAIGASGGSQGTAYGAGAGRMMSESTSRVLGTYNEIIATVPCCLTAGQPSTGVGLVLATYTDSAASALGEQLIGWGYHKSPASGVHTAHGVLQVKSTSSAASFALLGHRASAPLAPATVRSRARHVIAALSHPLLGRASSNGLLVSFLDRGFDHDAVRVSPVAVRIESSGDFLPGIGRVDAPLDALGTATPWGAFAVVNLPVRLSYPRAL